MPEVKLPLSVTEADNMPTFVIWARQHSNCAWQWNTNIYCQMSARLNLSFHSNEQVQGKAGYYLSHALLFCLVELSSDGLAP